MAAACSSLEQDICPALAGLWHTHRRPLVRLAVLLTGDVVTAETVVLDSLVALHRLGKCMPTGEGPLPALRRLVVTRARRAAHDHPPAGGVQGPPPFGGPGLHASPPETLRDGPAVVLALHALPAAQREAVVLTLYLDLTAERAAAAMRMSPAAVRRHLATARAALRTALPAGES